MSATCMGPDGGIGRRACFRCMYSQGCGGSSPLLGTIYTFAEDRQGLRNPRKTAIPTEPMVAIVRRCSPAATCFGGHPEFGLEVAPTMALSDVAIRNAKHGRKPIKLFDERGLFLLL